MWSLFACLLWVAPPDPEPFPLDLAFSARRFPYGHAPTMSDDGAVVAWQVETPPETSPGQELVEEPRFLPGGTPRSMVGVRVWLAVEGDDEPRPAYSGDANSYRPVVSPDGSRIAFFCDEGGVPRLWIHDVATGAARQAADVVAKPSLWSGDEPIFAPVGDEVWLRIRPDVAADEPSAGDPIEQGVAIEVHRSGAEQAPRADDPAPPGRSFRDAHFRKENLAGLVAVDLASGDVRPLVATDVDPPPCVFRRSASSRYVSWLSVFRSGDEHAMETVFDLAVRRAAGGTIHRVADDLKVPEGNYFGGTYRWHPTRDELVYLRQGALYVVSLDGDSMSTPRRLGEGLGALAPETLLYSRGGDAVIVGVDPIDRHDYRGPQPTAFASVDVETGDSRRFPTVDGYRVEGVLPGTEREAWQPLGRTITVRARHEVTGRRALLRLSLDRPSPDIGELGFARTTFGVGGPDHEQIVCIHEDTSTAPAVRSLGAELDLSPPISDIEPRYASVRIGSAEAFSTSVPSFDGGLVDVRCGVLLPRGARRGDRMPAICMIYAGGDLSTRLGPFGGGAPATIPAAIFTTRGYAVLLPHVPIGPVGEPGDPAVEMTDALLPQIRRAVELGYVDERRVALMGQSYGGYSTAAVLSRTNTFAAGVAISGIYDLLANYATMDPGGGTFGVGWSEGGQGRMGHPPWQGLDRYLRNSPFVRADRIRTPLLMLHGEKDSACPVEDARRMFVALKRLERDAQLAVYPGEGHVVSEWSRDHALDAYERVLAFLDRHLAE